MYITNMYDISAAILILQVLMPSCFGNADPLSELWNRIEALERRDMEQSSKIDKLEQEVRLSNKKLTLFSELNEDLQKDLAAKSKKLTEHEDIIEALKKDVELQADSNRRKVEILELKNQKLGARSEETDKLFVQPERNTEVPNDIKDLLDKTSEDPDINKDPNTLDSSTGYAEQGHPRLLYDAAAKAESTESELKSASGNHELAKNGIFETGSDLTGKLLDTITGNTLHTSDHGMLKNRQNGSQISKRFVANGVQSEPVAFHAVIAKGLVEHLGLDQNIVFETVNLNLGGGYHDQHGLFIAPKSGLYIFSISILSYVNTKSEIYAAIVKNGNILASAYGHGDSGRSDQGSVTMVTQLNVGDEISVKNKYVADDSLWGDKLSSFMGLLVVEM